MDFRATVNCDVLVHCPTQNANQNNLSVPVLLQILLSHTTDVSYVIFPEVHNASSLLAFSKNNKKRQVV